MIFEKACFFSHTATVGRGSCLLYLIRCDGNISCITGSFPDILRLAVNFPAEDMNRPERTIKKREALRSEHPYDQTTPDQWAERFPGVLPCICPYIPKDCQAPDHQQ